MGIASGTSDGSVAEGRGAPYEEAIAGAKAALANELANRANVGMTGAALGLAFMAGIGIFKLLLHSVLRPVPGSIIVMAIPLACALYSET